MSETPEKNGGTRIEKDRRGQERQRIHSLVYVEIGEGNGGIVLNIGETGISVQAAAVLDENGSVEMRVQIPRSRRKLELRGEIEWLSASRKEAGLRFIDLPESALEQIRKWMAREASPGDFEDETEEFPEEQSGKRAESPAETRRVPLAGAPPAADTPEAVQVSDVGGFSEEPEGQAESVDAFAALSIERDEPADSEDLEEAEAFAEEDESAVEADEDFDDEESIASGEVKEPIAAEATRGSKPEIEEKADEEWETEPESEPESANETEDELIRAFGPPVVPFERRPSQTPFSAMSAMSTPMRTSQNLAIATPLPAEARIPFAAEAAKMEPAPTSGWKNFRVQLQTGWFLAALVLLLALISFVAGMAVRRGALNTALGEQEEALTPRSAPVASPANSGAATNVAAQTGPATSASVAPAKPLAIEIVDLTDHHWSIPASTGSSRIGAATSGSDETVRGSASASPAAAEPKPQPSSAANSAENSAANAGASSPSAGASSATKPAPLVLNLPETPISATGSVAISSQRSVPVPADEAQSAQTGRNLQVGQLINLVEPTYPAEAFQKKIEGTVKLHAVIATDGSIETLTAVSGPKSLADASMAAVRNWKYSPTRMNGQAIETQEDISFVFRLPN